MLKIEPNYSHYLDNFDSSTETEIQTTIYNSNNDIKCGEIFLSQNNTKLYFTCSLCTKIFNKIKKFIAHCFNDHNIESWNVIDYLKNENNNSESDHTYEETDLKIENNFTNSAVIKEECSNMVVFDENKYEILEINNETESYHEYEVLESELKSDAEDHHTEINNWPIDRFENIPKDEVWESELESDNEDHTETNNDHIDRFKNMPKDIKIVIKKFQGNEESFIKSKNRTKTNKEESDFDSDSYDETLFNTNYKKNLMKCPVCLKTFVNIKTHMRQKHQTLLYKCTVPRCFENFIKESDLKDHLLEVHKDPERPFSCKDCNYKTNKKASLQCHFKRIHLGVKNKKCAYCDKKFYETGERRKHQRMHTGELPAVCDICGAAFKVTQQLNKHMKSHADPELSCEVCGKKFHLKENLDKHSYVHSNERSHICHVCGKGFKHNKYLKEHLDLHNEFKKYQCSICGKRFAQKNTWKGHLKIHRKDPEVSSIVEVEIDLNKL